MLNALTTYKAQTQTRQQVERAKYCTNIKCTIRNKKNQVLDRLCSVLSCIHCFQSLFIFQLASCKTKWHTQPIQDKKERSFYLGNNLTHIKTPLEDKAIIYSLSHWSSHIWAVASLGMRQSPRGLRLTLPTLGPSGRHERLNCCVKKRRINTLSQCFISSSVY